MEDRRTGSLTRNLILGFVSGALAVAVFHQLIYVVLAAAGLVAGTPYSMRPIPPFGVPAVFNSMFWGGLWGIVFALVVDRLPPRWAAFPWPLALSGFVFGLLGPVLIGWLVVAPIKGQPMMGGGNPARMLISVLLNGGFGVGVALIFVALRGWAARRKLA